MSGMSTANRISTVLVTGATDGIGAQTARELAEHGHHVLVHGRTQPKAQRAAEAITASAGKSTAVWGDFSDMSQVCALARQVSQATDTLQVLVNNAGIYASERRENADGFEMTMAVNHFAPFLLTHHLMQTLRAGAPARIVTVSSMTHASGAVDPNDLALAGSWSGYDAYCASKLANVLFARQLAAHNPADVLTSNSLHPGVVGTKLLREGFGGIGGASVKAGARTSVYLADAAELAGTTGEYFVDCKRAPVSAAASDTSLAADVWAATRHQLANYL